MVTRIGDGVMGYHFFRNYNELLDDSEQRQVTIVRPKRDIWVNSWLENEEPLSTRSLTFVIIGF